MMGGCSKGDRPALARASGIVKVNGIPVPMASIRFEPVNGGRSASAMTDEEGIYAMTTYDVPGDGAPVGEHRVSIMKVGGDGALTPVQEEAAKADPLSLSEIGADTTVDPVKAAPPKIEYLIPEKYMNPQTSGLTVTVPSEGSDKLDFDLKK
jgi:hypothetical protein